MNPTSVIDALERDPAAASKVLKENRGLQGLGREYFNRIMSHYMSDMNKAARLSAQWRAVLTYGDEPALAYRAKGISDIQRCDWKASARSFLKAGESATDPVERFAFKAGAIECLVEAGQAPRAQLLAEELVRGLSALGQEGQAARVQLGLANALIRQDRMLEARRLLDQAVPALRAGGMALEHVSALLALSTTHLYSGSPDRALELAQQTIVAAEANGSPFLAALARINGGHALLLLGRADEALEVLDSVRKLDEVEGERVRAVELSADAFYKLNLWPEAIDAYQEMLSSPGIFPNQAANARLGIGLCLIARDRAVEALPYLDQAYRRYRRLGNDAWASAALCARANALAHCGQLARAVSYAKRAAALARDAGSRYHNCEALLSLASLSRAAAEELDWVARQVRNNRYLPLEPQVHRERARRAPDARKLHHYRRMFEAILRGRLLVRSVSSRANYLRDKSDAVKEYLACLLERPTADRVRESMSVIERSRSVTLLDEILSSEQISLPQDVLQKLEDLRAELRQLSNGTPEQGSRRVQASEEPMAALQRKWIVAVRQATKLVETVPVSASQNVAVMAEAGGRLFCLESGSAQRLTITPEVLENELRWAEYELLAPMADRDCDAGAALEALQTLSSQVTEHVTRGVVCPDGSLWRVPWSACFAVSGRPEAELVLHPSLGGGPGDMLKDGAVVLWLAPSPDLPFAQGEAECFLEQFPHARICRTAREARASLTGDVRVFHVVGHARHRPENPMFSSVEFSDGSVFAAEIARSALKVDIVTLSACDTGALSLTTREEPDGLARAFLARSAGSVVASAWPLDDEAAARAFARFYEQVLLGAEVGAALRECRSELRLWREHPYFWGGLTLYRGYRR